MQHLMTAESAAKLAERLDRNNTDIAQRRLAEWLYAASIKAGGGSKLVMLSASEGFVS